MISITDVAGLRIYTVPRGLVAAAQRLFPGKTEAEAVYELARSIPADRLATVAAIAVNDIGGAVKHARRWLFVPKV
jgi:hypothetical protein